MFHYDEPAHRRLETCHFYAESSQSADPDWTYTVVETHEGMGVIEVADENGEFLGWL